METSTLPPKDLTLTVEEADASSQVLKSTLEALQAADQPEEKDVWLMEEGDDSVFYSDEDQDIKSNISCDVDANFCKRLGISETAGHYIPQKDGCPGAEMEKDVTPHYILAEQQLQTQTTETINQENPADKQRDANLTPGKSVRVSSGFLQPKPTGTNKEKHPEEKISQAHTKEEELMPQAQTLNIKLFDKLNEENYKRLNVEEIMAEEMSSSELQTSGTRRLQQDHSFDSAAGFHHTHTPGLSALPLLQNSSHTADHHDSFDHLTASKYSSVSYRRIRRGNTRQKIEEFEYMIINL